MPRFTYRFFEEVPPAAEAPLAAVEPILGERPRLFGPGPNHAYWFGRTDRHFAYLAGDEEGRRRILLEIRRLAWARSQGVRVPTVVEHAGDGSWLVSERVPADPPEGEGYVRAAYEAARRLATLPPPPADVLEGGYGRRAPRRGRLVRLARLANAGVSVAEFLELRRAAGELPADAVTHGDYHSNNILYDERGGVVTLTDFEMLGMAPWGSDLLLMWMTLDHDEDRERLIGELLAGADHEARLRLGILHRWIALRTLAERVAITRAEREAEPIAEARRLVGWSRTNARAWGRR